ncbi:uncharacterized protein [Lolium perenne]|uniref:uncharacterized protein n=1 Tax=Lolium perenne TaxID=4522 RepID=UPI0021F577F9|nr:uncharacterized protein LOC127316877 [Lolium perenne]
MAALSTVVSVRPSTLMDPTNADAADPASSTSARAGYPERVLLNKTARISADRNATTAACRTRDGQAVAVSFWLANPPDVSHFSVHCPGIEEGDFSKPPPYVISAEGAFVLFRVTLEGSDHHLVYSACGNPTTGKKKNKPSLHLLPDPKPAVEAFENQQFGLMPLGDEHYAVAFLDHRWDSRGNAWAYRAYVFSSKTKAWKRSRDASLHLSESDRLLFDRHASSKQITVGASSLGWVDLMRGIILLSNLFDGEPPVITYIPLPAEKVCITDKHGYPHYAPEYFCDVVCCDDLISFVEIDFEDPGCRANGKAWKATTWHRKVSWDDWHKHATVDVADISVDPRYSALLFPDLLLDDQKQELELKNLFFLNPTLGVSGDDDLLYMLAKVYEGDDAAWVAAVDMKHAALQALAAVSTKDSNAIPMYRECAFPKYYINNISSSDVGNLVEKDKSDKWQQGGPNLVDSGGNPQKKKRQKKKHARLVDRRVEHPFFLYFIGCIIIAIIVKVFFHLS